MQTSLSSVGVEEPSQPQHHAPYLGQSARSASRASSSSRSSHRPPDVVVPSFSSFRRRTPSGRRPTLVTARSDQLVETTSRASRRTSLPSSSPTHNVDVTVPPRSASVDSPTPRKLVHEPVWLAESIEESPAFVPRDLDLFPHGHTPAKSSIDGSIDERIQSLDHRIQTDALLHPISNPTANTSSSSVNRSRSSFHTAQNSISDYDGAGSTAETVTRSRHSSMSARSRTSPKPPDLTLQLDDTVVEPQRGSSPSGQRTPPKSPGAKISSFFGWKQQPQADSPTTFADSLSPAPSPMVLNGDMALQDSTYTSRSSSPTSHYGRSNDNELLVELKDITAELAASIRREMELEDELDRARTEMPNGPMEHQRRTSDYYSDSGASSTRMPIADSETKMEGLEKMRRKAEQEKAQLRLEMAQKAQDDLNQRKALELHVQSLEEQLKTSQRAEAAHDETSDRTRELEVSLEDAKRRLNEEKQFKENFEDLINGMRQEIEDYRNERDNLRDEVVPQLKARVDGLEAETAQLQTLAYEQTKLQQENQNLKNENQTLVNARKLQLDLQNSNGRFQSIDEEEDPLSPTSKTGLSRSTSMVRKGSQRLRSGSMGRGVPKDASSGEQHSDSLKDVEDQRDALHRTLKALIIRQDHMTRQHSKQLRKLEAERDSALNSTPRRAAFNIEVQHLRSEVNQLRRRADEAFEQKWQCEKGLSGLKMDLDRAQQETSSLRELLQEHDIFVPDRPSSQSSNGSVSPTRENESLEQTYAKLRRVHAQSVARMQDAPGSLDEVDSRMKALSSHIEEQIVSNRELRARLADAISRGEQEQAASAKKIVDLQAALKAADDRLASAQSVSEEAVAEQEEHIKAMLDAQGEKDKRGLVRSPSKAKPGEFLTRQNPAVGLAIQHPPMFSSKVPRLDVTTSGPNASVADTTKTEALEARVRELEQAASRADGEMQGVVEKMNRAQMEVAELQAQKDEALRHTRKLQREIIEERERFKAMA